MPTRGPVKNGVSSRTCRRASVYRSFEDVNAFREADVAWYDAHLAPDYLVISGDGTRVVAAAPLPDGLSGPGWRLSLTPAYAVLAADGAGVRRVAPAGVSPN